MILPNVPERYDPKMERARNGAIEAAERLNLKLRQDVPIVKPARLILRDDLSGPRYSIIATGPGTMAMVDLDTNVQYPIGGGITLPINESDVTNLISDLATINTALAARVLIASHAARSVLGRAPATVGDLADIVAGADGDILRRAAGVLAFGTIPESSVDNLVSDLGALAASILTKQAADATLTALAGIASTAGVIEQTSADAFSIRLIGTANATDLLTRAGGDGRYPPVARLINTTAPMTGGGDLSADRTLAVAVMVASGASHASGLVPDPGSSAGTAKFLCEDATFKNPSVATITPGLVGTPNKRYSASAVHSGLVNNDPVTTWDDLGSDGNNLTTILGTTDRPTYQTDPDGDGLAAVVFDGSAMAMRVRAMTAYTGTVLTVYAAVRIVTGAAARTVARLDNQSNNATSVQNCTLGWSASGLLTASNRTGGTVGSRPALAAATGITSAGGQGLWTVVAIRWGSWQSTYLVNMWDSHYCLGGAPIASSAFAWTRLSVGATPNDSTDAWVASTFTLMMLRELLIYKTAHTEAQVKQNLQYLASTWGIASWL